MTEPMNVDTDQVNSAGTILGRAAGTVPAPLPKLSFPGTDPLSLAVAKGAPQVEAPMAALPGIKAEATTTAQNIGLAGQKYAETDETLARKAREQQFATGEDKGSKDDVQKAAMTAAEETATRTADAVGKKTLETLGDAGRKANKGLVTAFEEGKVVPGSSLVGGGLKGIFAGVDVLANHADDPNHSWSKAIAKTAGSTAVSFGVEYATAAAVQLLIPIPGVGAAIGFGVGYLASEYADQYVDENWEAWADGVGSVKNAVASVFGFG